MRDEKQLLLNEIKEKIDSSTAMIVARYDKLTPNASWSLRGQLAQSGSLFEVVKKRVFLKAAELSGIKIDESMLIGHVGVVFVNQPDAMPSAKTLMKFSADNGDVVQVICGQIEGKIVPGDEVVALSKLPGLEEMRAEFLALLISPMAQTLSVIDAAMSGPLSVIEQKSQTE
jgi:large subunit ribosomal protein L10